MKKRIALLSCLLVFMVTPVFSRNAIPAPASETFANSLYIGIYGGPYENNYLPSNEYFDFASGVGAAPENALIANSFQNYGGSGGLSLGYLRRLSSTLSFLLEVDGVLNSDNKFRQSNHVPFEISNLNPSFDVMTQYKTDYYVDVLTGLSLRLSPFSDFFAKVGVSFSALQTNIETKNSLTDSPPPSNFFENRKSLTGLAIELGISRKVNNVVTLFAEYAYRYFGRYTLATLFGPDPVSPPRPENQLKRQIQIQSNAVYVGANFNYANITRKMFMPRINPFEEFANSFYFGILGGFYQHNYLPEYTYFERSQGGAECNLNATAFHNDGGAGGVLFGYTHRFTSSYAVLFEIDGLINSGDSALQSTHIPNDVSDTSPSFDFINQYKMHYYADILGGLSVSLSPYSNLFAKVGVVFSTLTINAKLTRNIPEPFFNSFLTKKPITGLAIMLGLTRKINSVVTLFAEYAYRYFGNFHLETLIAPDPVFNPPRPDNRIERLIQVQSNAVYVGANFNFANFTAEPNDHIISPIRFFPNSLYLGISVGPYQNQYLARFHYDERTSFGSENYTSAGVFHNDGASGVLSLGYIRRLNQSFSALIEVVGTLNTYDSAKDSQHIEPDISDLATSWDYIVQYRMNYYADILAGLSVSLSYYSDLYTKLGVSFSDLQVNAETNQAPNVPSFFFVNKKPITGLVVAVGITRKINSVITLFAQYTYRYFGHYDLPTILSPDPLTTPRPENSLERAIEIQTQAVYAGVMFNINFS